MRSPPSVEWFRKPVAEASPCNYSTIHATTRTTRRSAAGSSTGWTTSVPCRSTRPTRRVPASCSPGARPGDDYRELVRPYPLVRDRPEEREPLLRLDAVLDALDRVGVHVPSPRTWPLT